MISSITIIVHHLKSEKLIVISKIASLSSFFSISMLNLLYYHNFSPRQVLLHGQGEKPMVKDLGFAVAPGTHTLVGVKYFAVSS